jgi:hypothetical protein
VDIAVHVEIVEVDVVPPGRMKLIRRQVDVHVDALALGLDTGGDTPL